MVCDRVFSISSEIMIPMIDPRILYMMSIGSNDRVLKSPCIASELVAISIIMQKVIKVVFFLGFSMFMIPCKFPGKVNQDGQH